MWRSGVDVGESQVKFNVSYCVNTGRLACIHTATIAVTQALYTVLPRLILL